jgi:hypothetical protein
MARSITNVYQEQSFDLKATDLDPANWAKEGLNLANTAVYATAENQVPSAIYIESEKKIVQQQLALAGYRLANLLNFLLSDKEDIH